MSPSTAVRQKIEQEVLNDLITEAEVAEILHCTERTVRNYRYRGVGPAVMVIGKKPLYRRTAVIDWMLERERPGR